MLFWIKILIMNQIINSFPEKFFRFLQTWYSSALRLPHWFANPPQARLRNFGYAIFFKSGISNPIQKPPVVISTSKSILSHFRWQPIIAEDLWKYSTVTKVRQDWRRGRLLDMVACQVLLAHELWARSCFYAFQFSSLPKAQKFEVFQTMPNFENEVPCAQAALRVRSPPGPHWKWPARWEPGGLPVQFASRVRKWWVWGWLRKAIQRLPLSLFR